MKIVVYDLEVGELIGTTYEVYDARIRTILQPKYLLCFSYIVFDTDEYLKTGKIPKPKGVKLSDFPARFKANPFDDYDVARELNKVLKTGHARMAYNGKRFDDPVSNTRFSYHGLENIDFKTMPMIDPMRIIKRNMKLERNSLDYACKFYGIKGKTKVTYGMVDQECSQVENWWNHQPIEIVKKAWKLMDDYCKNDSEILLELYLKVRHMDTTHPNISVYGDKHSCPVCGGRNLKSNGIRATNTMIYRRLNCNDCGAPIKARLSDKDEQNKPEYMR